MSNVLLTRSSKNSRELIKALEREGFKVFSEPLFTVEEFSNLEVGKNISVAIITSQNACKALINSELSRDIKIFSVGKKTAEKLTAAGFGNIYVSLENSAESLKNLIVEKVDRASEIAYFHGSIITLDFAKELQESGFKVQKILAYKTEEVADFSPEILKKCSNEKFGRVLIFSKNSARIFFKLVVRHNMLEYFSDSQILCLSKKILDESKRLGFKKCATFSDFPILAKFYD